MKDEELISRIDELIREEHELHHHSSAGRPISTGDARRLGELHVQLDQLWDLLRRRRARRGAGEDPDLAELRSAEVVEDYEQ